ncbi:hypothetical protein ACLOJK_016665 [Asimina triloba]
MKAGIRAELTHRVINAMQVFGNFQSSSPPHPVISSDHQRRKAGPCPVFASKSPPVDDDDDESPNAESLTHLSIHIFLFLPILFTPSHLLPAVQMAITKHGIRDSRSNREFSPLQSDHDESDSRSPSSGSRGSLDYDDASAFNDDCCDDDDVDDDDEGNVDSSGAELCEIGAELCLLEQWNCSVPYELYDLPDLKGVLSIDSWNNCLSDEDRFGLAEFLPDMDQETYGQTLKELFEGRNFHFGSPLTDLFQRLKGGLYEPRVALYHQGLNFFGRDCHYHLLRKYQNCMVRSLFRVRDALEMSWNCGIEEKLRILQAVRSHRTLMHDKDSRLGFGTDSPAREVIDEGFRSKKVKVKHGDLYTVRPSTNVLVQGTSRTLEASRYEKQNRKGISQVQLKVYSKKDRVGGNANDIQMKFSPAMKFPATDTFAAVGVDKSVPQGENNSFSKKHDRAHVGLAEEENVSRALHLSPLRKKNLHSNGRNHNVKWTIDEETPSEKLYHYDHPSQDHRKRSRATKKLSSLGVNRMKPVRHKEQLLYSEVSQENLLVKDLAFQNRHALQDDLVSTDHTLQLQSNVGRKKQKTRGDFQAVRKGLIKSSGKISHPIDQTSKLSTELYRRNHFQYQHTNKEEHKGIAMSGYDEETESDSSEKVGGDDDINASGHVSGKFGRSQSSSVRRAADPWQSSRQMWREEREHGESIHGVTRTSRKIIDLGEHVHKPKAKWSHSSNSFDPYYSNLDLEGKRNNKLVQDGQIHEDNCGADTLYRNAYSADRKQKGKRKVNHDNSLPLSDCADKFAHEILDKDDLPGVTDQTQTHKSWKKDAKACLTEADAQERSSMQLLGCSSTMQKQKRKADAKHLDGSDMHSCLHSVLQQPIDDPSSMKKNGKKKVDAESTRSAVLTSDAIASDREMFDGDMDTNLPKKPFTLITPSVHTGFSFSIIHLLSAVRRAMTMSHVDDTGEVDRILVKNGSANFPADENLDVNDSECIARKNLPSLTVQEIVNFVRSNPGDPCILEMQEPLQDLVRGVLKIFSSKTAPLGAKAWKPIVFYDKSSKNWSWIGPVSSSSLDGDTIMEETSSDAWGVPHKMLVKLVDAFANWLKSGQETLKQIGSLPPPPPMLPSLDEKERFKDLRAQKSLATISPSSDEMREYFRREEVLRYSIPDRAFSYTATDGRKSIVAPLRRSGGKAREHFILKPDRPPHVTILCLVRDAAARLPGSIGTRADVCTLIRDSQYIVENISDAQLNQIVSGALDRLHYERDPCVQFDAERKLWVYLHRDREEEDLEDDGTSSTKKWKRPRKGSAGTITDGGLQGAGDQVGGGSAIVSDLNTEASSIAAQQTELADHDLQEDLEESIGQFIEGAQNSVAHPMGWECSLQASSSEKLALELEFTIVVGVSGTGYCI